ncbi:putative proton-dependent oligopeptide transporter family [Rosa chinensis]|uniref:Putative proton-dependent oligopeptide transporter family n=1 Tax=Rosa chinensis TaxID=74649 RepID=A0A2P6SJP6_ROSCH|nr:putative proton-dependent oligopeptide transporter family [Rosa chinensis]
MEVEGKLSTHSTSKEEEGEVHRVCDENQDSKGGWTTFPFVIATVLGLSVAVGGWGANLIVFLITKFNVKTITAIQINNIILGTTNLLPIAGAFIADSFFTIFSVVSVFSFISLLVINHNFSLPFTILHVVRMMEKVFNLYGAMVEDNLTPPKIFFLILKK